MRMCMLIKIVHVDLDLCDEKTHLPMAGASTPSLVAIKETVNIVSRDSDSSSSNDEDDDNDNNENDDGINLGDLI